MFNFVLLYVLRTLFKRFSILEKEESDIGSMNYSKQEMLVTFWNDHA